MKTILCMVLLALSSPVLAQPGSGSAGSATPTTAGSGSGAAPSTGSAAGSANPGAGSGSADTGAPAPAPPPPPEPAAEPNPAARQACVEAMNADEKFAQRVILVAEQKLAEKMNSEQVLKDLCVLRDHTDSQQDVAKNKKHVLLAYIAMWLVAAGFVIFMWRKQQALKLEIANLRRDLDAATKDDK